MDSIFSTMYGIFFGNYENADKAGRTETDNGYTIDTCDTVDFGWETAIWYKDNDMVIVERYEDKSNAEIGHKKWVEFCKTNPKSVWSVQLDCEEDLR